MLGDPKKAEKAKQVSLATEAKIEKHFKSHPELPTGRDFKFNHTTYPGDNKRYREGFDAIFPNSPGAGI